MHVFALATLHFILNCIHVLFKSNLVPTENRISQNRGEIRIVLLFILFDIDCFGCASSFDTTLKCQMTMYT